MPIFKCELVNKDATKTVAVGTVEAPDIPMIVTHFNTMYKRFTIRTRHENGIADEDPNYIFCETDVWIFKQDKPVIC